VAVAPAGRHDGERAVKVLYVSKAMATLAYRDKLRELATRVALRAVAPTHWGRPADPATADEPWLRLLPARFTGHNHFHVYHAVNAVFAGDPPDLVHIDEEPYSAVTAQLARHCVRRRLPFVFFAWQNLEKRIPLPFAGLRRYVFRHARAGLAGSAAAAAVLRAWGFNGRVEVIPQMGVNAQRFRPDAVARAAVRARIGARPGDFVVGFGGRLVREKGVHLLLQATLPLPHARLVFLGDGPERAALLAAARDAGAGERVLVQDAVPGHAVAAWLPGFDVVVLPSRRTRGWMEQFGRILVEAMACGVAVVGSSSGEIPQVIGDAGMVFPEGDAAALGDVLRGLAASPERRAALGARAQARVLEHFTNRSIADRTVRFYGEILGAGRARDAHALPVDHEVGLLAEPAP
jgi:glycosyltransferase involved in cell wall biosynthesis